jgi:hypothetical protein
MIICHPGITGSDASRLAGESAGSSASAPPTAVPRKWTDRTARVQHFISSYGYLAILLLMTAESACIPVPSELTMPLAEARTG